MKRLRRECKSGNERKEGFSAIGCKNERDEYSRIGKKEKKKLERKRRE